MVFATRSEGGVWQDSGSRCGKPTFRYLPYSSVVIPCESAPPVPNGRKRGGRERPPQKVGGHVTPDSGAEWHASIRPQCGSLSSSYIPAGRLGNSPPEGVLKERETDL